MLQRRQSVTKPSKSGLLFLPLVHSEGVRVINLSPSKTYPSRKFVNALYSSQGNDFSLRKETRGFLLTASNSVLPAVLISPGVALMKGDFDELCERSFQREGCRKTRLSGRCTFASISVLSLTHIPAKHHWHWTESPWGPIYLPEWLSLSWSPRRSDTGKANQFSRSDGLCLSCSLLGRGHFKANS